MDVLLVTNNPMILAREPCAQFVDGPALAVLIAARDLAHRGHRLLTHPMAGSIPPGKLPYRSLLLSVHCGPPDPDSIAWLESAVLVATRASPPPNTAEARLRDLQFIDATLLESARRNID